MNGKVVALALAVSGVLAGVGLYWTQVYAFYERVPQDAADVQLTGIASGMSEPVAFENFEAIDAESSPLRYRACYTLTPPIETLVGTYELYDRPVPLEAPGWFDCYDADEIGAALERGTAVAFLGEANIVYGIDRVVAVSPDRRAWSWHQINRCGEEVFDGRPAPEGCPPPPERTE